MNIDIKLYTMLELIKLHKLQYDFEPTEEDLMRLIERLIAEEYLRELEKKK